METKLHVEREEYDWAVNVLFTLRVKAACEFVANKELSSRFLLVLAKPSAIPSGALTRSVRNTIPRL